MADTCDSCVVCFKTVDYYSIGQCDHPVCYECSTRMRVLCLQNECPICRQMLAKVVFTDQVQPYESFRHHAFSDKLFERQFKIAFCSDEIKKAYETVLEHRCKICPDLTPFRTFEMLSDHMRKIHEKFYCDLCVKHLKWAQVIVLKNASLDASGYPEKRRQAIFTSERKFYSRQELAYHRRKGDPDDTSHRGHPLCQFCEVRYMDNDELYRHLRKDHLYCHLCDADGRNQYYASHAELARHFRTDHYLCEEGECAGDHLTSVFRTEIDLKAHKALVHGKGMPRAAARQARTLELQFNITPHQFAARNQRLEASVAREAERAAAEWESAPPAQPPPPRAHIDTGSVEQFPRLSAAPAPPTLAPLSRHYQGGSNNLARTNENFPALNGGGGARAPPPPAAPASRRPPAAAILKTNGKQGVSIQLQPGSASQFRLTGAGGSRVSPAPAPAPAPRRPAFDDDFPSLVPPDDDKPSIGAATPQPPKVTVVSSEQMQAMKATQAAPAPAPATAARARLDAEAFPALTADSKPAAPPQWITLAKKKDKPKPQSKVAPAPDLSQPSFNPVADFPQLAINNAKVKNKNKQNNHSPPNVTEDKKNDKKKQNGKASKSERSALVNGSAGAAESAWGARRRAGPEDAGSSGDRAAPARPRDAFPALPGLTFTNSAGEVFAAPLHHYIPPPHFEKRNVELVRRFATAVGADTADEFKLASRAFRTGGLSAERFYAACRRSLGAQLDALFPELVALLPDIGLQQALAGSAPAAPAAALHMCAACGQLLQPADQADHRDHHWPPAAAPAPAPAPAASRIH